MVVSLLLMMNVSCTYSFTHCYHSKSFHIAVEISFIQDTPTTDGFFVVEYDNLGSFTRATCTLPRRRTPEVDCKFYYLDN